jgi:trehalose 6-phosphate phosphatase
VISGRAQEDIQERLAGTGVFEIIGNHGLEPRSPREADAARVQTWVPELQQKLGGLPGTILENKGYSLAVHYRRSLAPANARATIFRAAAGLAGVRVIGGKRVVNLLPRDGPNKGTALQMASEKFRSELTVYLGDDDTDEDVFTLGDAVRLLTIRVGRRRGSSAAYYVATQRSVDTLLAALVQMRDQVWRQSG